MYEFKHPKYYKELRKLRNKEARRVQGCLPTNELHNSDQVISDEASTEATSVHPDPGLKPQASGVKLSNQPDQASSDKRQAPGSKRQASSHKRQAL
jgi:hypothetical protein